MREVIRMSNDTIAATEFGFLAAGPIHNLVIPDEFDRIPELSSPVRNGIGGRSFVFKPANRDRGLDPQDNERLGSIRDRDGRDVELYRRLADPPLWRLQWRLANGSLYTHLREEDGVAMAQVTTGLVSVMDEGQTPLIAVYPPFEYGASTLPGFQEEGRFTSDSLGPMNNITLERPGQLAPGEAYVRTRTPSDGIAVIRFGLEGGVDATVTVGSDMGRTEAVADLLRENWEIV